MPHFLDGERRRGHKSESVNEVGEFVFLVEFSFDDVPTGEIGEGVLKLRAGESSHTFIIAPWSIDSFRYEVTR